jgi:hypothetical protein
MRRERRRQGRKTRPVRPTRPNAPLFEVKAHGVELVGQTIEGNEAFLRAVGESRR